MWIDIIHITWPYGLLIAAILGAAAVVPEEEQEGER